ncbi:hypothetical protein [Rhizobium ruizarguesonis]|uniref:hypothetical protein n=1 Tax=Rhizobium ruizarguesonis TaxID=2081791 RepID=UPI001031449D|nr:hypothetical protein [Rhizobium ruizarguesonis]TBB72041.1 hypothetical protein ELH45_16435 [Rhizobium ruizarguesonis]
MKSYLLPASIGAALGFVLAIWMFPVWQAWVFAFQTLITGFFAVGAAYLTVRQMQVTDKAAQLRHDELLMTAKQNDKEARERHNELVELSIRKDRLVVERLLFPYLSILDLQRGLIASGSLVLPPFENIDDPALQPFTAQAKEHTEPVFSVMNITIQPAWQDAAPLLDGLTSHHLRELAACAHKCIDLSNYIQDYPVPPLIEADESLTLLRQNAHLQLMRGKSEKVLREMVYDYNLTVAFFTNELRDLIDGLEKLGKKYGLNS